MPDRKKYPVTLIRQNNQGPAAARNHGAGAARGKILVFTDSDCELSESFLEKIIAPMDTCQEIAGVQGRYKTKQREFIAEFHQVEMETRYQLMSQRKYIDFIGTYAAAYRKDIFQKFGGFDTTFPLASNEDVEFSYLLSKNNKKMVFASDAIVYHQHPTFIFQYLKIKFI
ncbi:MAG: glycosyltransferase, partial [Candidatus Aminicenantes bacterium]